MRAASARAVLGILVVAGLGMAGCSSGTSAAPARSTTTTKYVQPPEVVTPTTTINGASVTVPLDRAGKPILPLRDNGTQIILTTKGILPQDLEACVSAPMTWTNLTSKPVKIWNNQVPPVFAPTVIAAGKSFTYTPPATIEFSFLYHTSLGFDGAVEVGQVPGAC